MVTLRFYHHPTHTPITELEVESSTSIRDLRAMLDDRIATDEYCPMRVVAKWHVDLLKGPNNRQLQTDLSSLDTEESIASMGIEDYSEVLLEGPLTNTIEGVGHALAIMNVQWRHQNAQVVSLLQQIAKGQNRSEARYQMDNETFRALEGLRAEERVAFCKILILFETDKVFHTLCHEASMAFKAIYLEAAQAFQLLGCGCFTIDRCLLNANVAVEDSYTALRTGAPNDWATLRSAMPLSFAHHQWAVRIIEGVNPMPIMLGMVPNTPGMVLGTQTDHNAYIGSPSVGGWSIYADGRSYGNWQCEKFPFSKGDVVAFDYSFGDKSLTISCGQRQVVGRIPAIQSGQELYPAFTLYSRGQKVEFTKFPRQ